MGWDSYALRPEIAPRAPGQGPLLSPHLKEIFRKANASPLLDGPCAGILYRTSGIPDYDETNPDGELLWSPETANKAQTSAHWDISLQEWQNQEGLIQTQLFLEVCASNGLAIWFTWQIGREIAEPNSSVN